MDSTMYMCIDGVTPQGASTNIPGREGFFPIDSISWGAVRGVGIDIGKGNNADQGMVELGTIDITRSCDGATPYLTTFLYAPGPEGKTVEIVITQPNRQGSGLDPYLIITLRGVRMASYKMTGSDGSVPNESFSLTYTHISKSYYIEGEGGKIEKGHEVGFDPTTAKVTSTAS